MRDGRPGPPPRDAGEVVPLVKGEHTGAFGHGNLQAAAAGTWQEVHRETESAALGVRRPHPELVSRADGLSRVSGSGHAVSRLGRRRRPGLVLRGSRIVKFGLPASSLRALAELASHPTPRALGRAVIAGADLRDRTGSAAGLPDLSATAVQALDAVSEVREAYRRARPAPEAQEAPSSMGTSRTLA